MTISNAGPGPRCHECGARAVYEYEMTVHARVYALTREGERGHLLSERRPRSSTSYLCPLHGRPFLPRLR